MKQQPEEISEFLIVFFTLIVSLEEQQQCEVKRHIVEVKTRSVSAYN